MLSRLSSIAKLTIPAALAFQVFSADESHAQQPNLEPENAGRVELVDPAKRVTDTSITFNPGAPFNTSTGALIGGGLGGLALLFALYAYRRKLKVAAPYAVAGGLMALMIANPEILKENYDQLPSEIVVMVDETASNSITDRATIREQVKRQLQEQFGKIPNINVRFVPVDGTLDGANGGSKIFEALGKVDNLNPDHLGGIIVLTDGQIHDVPDLSPFGNDVPIHTLIIGQPDEKDRVAELIASPRFGLVGEKHTIRFKVDDKGTGAQSGEPISVRISGGAEGAHTIKAVPGEVIETQITIANPGSNIITVEAEALDGEITDVNNRIVVKIDGVREDLNVLMISGKINGSVRELRDFYQSDPDSNVIHFMSMRLSEDFDDTPRKELALTRVPLHEVFGQALEKFDLIVFDHYEDFNTLPARYLKGIADYVEKGGSLLVVAGPEYAGSRSLHTTPIGSILPVRPNGRVTEEIFKPSATDLGGRHPVIRGLNGLGDGAEPTWGPWTRAVSGEVTSGRTLLQTPDGKPLLVVDNKGEGRVAMLMSDSFPLWGAGFEGGGPDAQLLRRTSHWLMKSPELEEEALFLSATGNSELIIRRQTMSEEKPAAIEIRRPDGQTETVEFTEQVSPGVWQITYPYDKEGIYSVTQGSGENIFTRNISVGLNQTKELADVI